jgi:nucleotide-binding universal stress UspA family protein
MYSHILVPIDDSAPAQRGLTEAISLARAIGSQLHMLHVVDLRALITSGAGYAPAPQLTADWKAMGELLVAKAVEQARLQGVAADSAVTCDPTLRVCDAILEEAKRSKADLIVMGTHGRRGLTRVALGSDAELVLRESQVPVLLVRAAA